MSAFFKLVGFATFCWYNFNCFISRGSFQLIFLNKRKVYLVMSRSFATQALSRTATNITKQSTISTQNTFTFFQICLSQFGRWLEKYNELRSIWVIAYSSPKGLLHLPRPWAPPADYSPSSCQEPFCSSEGDNLTAPAHLGGPATFAPSPIWTQGLC